MCPEFEELGNFGQRDARETWDKHGVGSRARIASRLISIFDWLLLRNSSDLGNRYNIGKLRFRAFQQITKRSVPVGLENRVIGCWSISDVCSSSQPAPYEKLLSITER